MRHKVGDRFRITGAPFIYGVPGDVFVIVHPRNLNLYLVRMEETDRYANVSDEWIEESCEPYNGTLTLQEAIDNLL